jgi:DNA-binding transcriptional ArsR family regulator
VDVEDCTTAACVPERYESRWTPTDGVADKHIIQIICYLSATVTATATKAELADRLDCSRTTVTRAIDSLRDDGIVDCVLVGNTTVYWLIHPDSEWPVPNDVDLVTDTPFNAGAESDWQVLRGDPPVMWRHLGTGGCYLAIIQAAASLLIGVVSQPLAERVLMASMITLATVILLGVLLAARSALGWA